MVMMAKAVSKIVYAMAKKSVEVTCPWRAYQPKVPKKLLEKGKK